MKSATSQTIQAGDQVTRDQATANPGKVQIGDYAPAFVRPGDKAVRDGATANPGKVQIGDYAPVFGK